MKSVYYPPKPFKTADVGVVHRMPFGAILGTLDLVRLLSIAEVIGVVIEVIGDSSRLTKVKISSKYPHVDPAVDCFGPPCCLQRPAWSDPLVLSVQVPKKRPLKGIIPIYSYSSMRKDI